MSNTRLLLSITFYETKCTLSDEKTLPFRYLTKFAETSCNFLGIELTQHKHFSEEVAKWKIGFVKIKTIMRAFEFRKEGLEYLQKLPLEEKITLSKNLIVSCMETFGEQVYISFSGGKDSTVLSSLVCSLKPDILHLFSDTGCEYPETLSFVEEERQRGKTLCLCVPFVGMVRYGPLSV